MKTQVRRIKLYTVVEVWRGIAVGARNFRTLKGAENHTRRLRRGRNLQEDDVQLFENTIRLLR